VLGGSLRRHGFDNGETITDEVVAEVSIDSLAREVERVRSLDSADAHGFRSAHNSVFFSSVAVISESVLVSASGKNLIGPVVM